MKQNQGNGGMLKKTCKWLILWGAWFPFYPLYSELPQIAELPLSAQQEAAFGAQWLRLQRRHFTFHDDPFVIQYVEDLLARLAIHSGIKDTTLTLLVLEDDNINAFAAPGGIIGVHTGLLRFFDDEGQLASVLTHELAHLKQRHFQRQLQTISENKKVNTTLLLAGLGLLLSGQSELGISAALGAPAWSAESQLRFSRDFEREADLVGLTILQASGFAADYAVQSLEALQRLSTADPDLAFLYTHPLGVERVRYLRAHTATLASSSSRDQTADRVDFSLIQVRLGSTLRRSTTNEVAQRYHKILIAVVEDCVLALDESARLAQDYPLSVYAQGIMIETLGACAQWELAQQRAEILLQEYGHHRLLRILYARVLNQRQMHHAAMQQYALLAREFPQDAENWLLLAQTAHRAKDPIMAHRAQAEYHQWYGDFDAALLQLRQALQYTDDPMLSAQIGVRQRELEQLRAEFRKGLSIP